MKFIEQHIHGAFGIDFMNCGEDDFIEVAKKLFELDVAEFFPTLMTGETGQIKNQIAKIKNAAAKNVDNAACIGGIHLEGPFINPKKCGIHQKEYMLSPSVENYKKIEDDFIKIVTVAPELDEDLIEYLRWKNVKVSAGHCLGSDLSKCDGVTHIFNAMKTISHREPNTVTSALLDDNLYVEVIADGNHICDDVLKLIFKIKPADKIILISDALAQAHSEQTEFDFAGKKVSLKDGAFYDNEGTLAGSASLLPDIAKRLQIQGLLTNDKIERACFYNPKTYLHG